MLKHTSMLAALVLGMSDEPGKGLCALEAAKKHAKACGRYSGGSVRISGLSALNDPANFLSPGGKVRGCSMNAQELTERLRGGIFDDQCTIADKSLRQRIVLVVAIPEPEFEGIVGERRESLETANKRVTTNILKAADNAHNHRAQGTGGLPDYPSERSARGQPTVLCPFSSGG